MRKCPNCKKAVPVGARRCTQCRSLVGDAADLDAMNAVTRLGDNSRSGNYHDPQDQHNAQHTMIGLGPISSSPSRRSSEDLSRNFGQQTIAGMPGISFESNGRQGGYRMAATSTNTPSKGLAPVTTPSHTFHSPYAQENQNTHQSTQAKTTTPSFDQPEEEDNALAGLPGVSVVPSSLVDEEFDDLTSKLFGDDFVINTDDNDEEEGWDFDVPTAPAPTPAPIHTPQTQKTNPSTQTNQNTTPKQSPKTTQPRKTGKKQNKKQIIFDRVAIGTTIAAAAILLIWTVVALFSKQDPNQGSILPTMLVAILNIAGSTVVALFYKQLKPILTTAITGGLAILLLITMFISGTSGILLMLGILCQVACACACFLKN